MIREDVLLFDFNILTPDENIIAFEQLRFERPHAPAID